jgi:hypothetical protein
MARNSPDRQFLKLQEQVLALANELTHVKEKLSALIAWREELEAESAGVSDDGYPDNGDRD